MASAVAYPLDRLACRRRFAAEVSVPDHEVDLGAAALWLAAEEYRGLDPHVYLARLESLADRVHVALGGRSSPEAALAALQRVLVLEEGFQGNRDDYYEPANSFLNEVLDRRTGIPITLSVVWLEVARRADIALEGVNLPGHFLVRLVYPGGGRLLDPFDGGRDLDLEQAAALLRSLRGPDAELLPEHLVGVGPKQILVRMLNNLRLIWLENDDHARAVAAIDRIVVIAGETPGLRRERGMLFAELQLWAPAWADLAASLEPSGQDLDAERLATVRQQLEHVRRMAAGPN